MKEIILFLILSHNQPSHQPSHLKPWGDLNSSLSGGSSVSNSLFDDG